ncbi:membrane progestin receptor alpha-B-like [Mytilus californianus]|uniref:membrane progestin receptor alpha-B-like n=1 Tax=Mytilus californianus TaxID=6549 RepID=UPI0022476DF8|nr:membrane progestin receptor alpha-B-like [Mytilus californianus]XP_052057950.1 membrane progestin receptor alpha-B-like [Mytilus californianus]XP_052057951.1 membrane progestin receptor alpha-B-like [Mytilus californianus]XP_052057952.1 membrane progestin receptor alpha-B-like [Mytilus californianus]XP_052057953.1 membrane progestin receptor alpha-B-like [Mytilus californianus]
MESFQGLSDRVRRVFSETVQLGLKPTLNDHKVPQLFREPGVINGYRKPHQPFRYYLISLFQIHNETVNVWTHIVGFFVIWFAMAEYYEKLDFWNNKHSWAMLVLGCCVLIACFVSSCVHLMHSKSENWHYNAFMIDYIGAALYAYGSGVMAFYICSDRETYYVIEKYYFPILWFYSLFNYTAMCFAKVYYGSDTHNRNRKLIMVAAMAGHAILLTIPMGPRYIKCYMDETCSLSSLNHLTICYILFALQAFFFASHLPEVLIPGKFDILGQGHQIFHVLSTICQCAQFNGIYHEIHTGHAAHGDPDLTHLIFSTIMLIILQVVVMQFMRKMIPVKSTKSC